MEILAREIWDKKVRWERYGLRVGGREGERERTEI